MSHLKSRRTLVVLLLLLVTGALVAQEAKVRVNVTPALGFFSHGVAPQMFLAQGSGAGKGGGRLEIKGVKGSDAVYLNGTGKDFYVGTVKDSQIKELVLPPGQQHVILIDPNGDKQVYSAYVDIKPGQKSTLHVDTSSIAYENWAGGPPTVAATTGNVSAGGASTSEHYVQTSYPVVTGTFSAPKEIPCGDKARLVWNTNGYYSMMKAYGKSIYDEASGSGELLVDPGLNGTTYILESFGPGGVFISDPQTVRVSNEVYGKLDVTPEKSAYHRIGDKVIEDPQVKVSWHTEHAKSIVIDPIGPVTGPDGEKVIAFTPGNDSVGNRIENIKYTLTAENPCGKTFSTAASSEVAVNIDPEIVATALPPVLPKTGSPLPLIALLGFGSVLSGLVLRMFRKK